MLIAGQKSILYLRDLRLTFYCGEDGYRESGVQTPAEGQLESVSNASEEGHESLYHCTSCESSCFGIISQDTIDPRNQDRCYRGCKAKQVETQNCIQSQHRVVDAYLGGLVTFQCDWNIPNQQTQASEQQYCLINTHYYPQRVEHAQ